MATKKADKAVEPEVSSAGGRPCLYSEAILYEIADRLSKGEPLAVICRDEGMPSDTTVRNWMGREDIGQHVSSVIARAREVGFDALAADCLMIADDSSEDFRMGEKGLVFDSDHVQRSKLRIETRLKLLAKWDPKRYGDSVTVKGDKENPLEVRSKRDLTDAELAAIAAGGLRGVD